MIQDGGRDARKARRALMTGWREVHRLLEAGYERRRRGAEAGACEESLKAWSLLLKTMDERSPSAVSRRSTTGLPGGLPSAPGCRIST